MIRLCAALLFLATAFRVDAAEARPGSATLYVGPHFEIRDQEEPVKYVFNGDTRVARITGSLSANKRIQRLRLQAGWTLCGIAVSETQWPAQGAVVAAFRWNPTTRGYAVLRAGQPLEFGSVLWVKASINTVVSLVGSYVTPVKPSLKGGGAYLSSPVLGAWRVQWPAGTTVWRFDAAKSDWQHAFSGDLAGLSTLPPGLSPGEAVYIHTDRPMELEVPDAALGVAYYHPDHLGSLAAVTDAQGALVQESAYYPFGSVRHEEQWRDLETHYSFTQKERDQESGFEHFGHRYYRSGIARWLSLDPLGESGGGQNPYAYVNQNPLKLYDPDGAEIKVTKSVKAGSTTYQISLKAAFIDVSSKKFSQADLAKHAATLKSTIENSFKGKKGKVQWVTTVDLRVVENWSQVGKEDHVFRLVDKTSTGAAGNSELGGMLMDLAARNYSKLRPDQVDQSNPANKHYTWKNYTSPEGTGAHEFGHTAGLPHNDHESNLMQEGSLREYDNKDVTVKQLETIVKAAQAKQLNKRDAALKDLVK